MARFDHYVQGMNPRLVDGPPMERLASAVSKLHAYCRTQGRGHQFENSRVGRTSGCGEADQELYEYAPDSATTVRFEAALLHGSPVYP